MQAEEKTREQLQQERTGKGEECLLNAVEDVEDMENALTPCPSPAYRRGEFPDSSLIPCLSSFVLSTLLQPTRLLRSQQHFGRLLAGGCGPVAENLADALGMRENSSRRCRAGAKKSTARSAKAFFTSP